MRLLKGYFLIVFIVGTSNFLHAQNDQVIQASVISSVLLKEVQTEKNTTISLSSFNNSLTLFVFLSPECPLCQNYTTVLNALYKQYQQQIRVYGIFPGKAYSAIEIAAFAKKYQTNFTLLIDSSQQLTNYLKATITPEVILLNDKNQLAYRGAIDNWVLSLGKKRIKATLHYLQDAIEQTLQNKTTAIKTTKPVGCKINDY